MAGAPMAASASWAFSESSPAEEGHLRHFLEQRRGGLRGFDLDGIEQIGDGGRADGRERILGFFRIVAGQFVDPLADGSSVVDGPFRPDEDRNHDEREEHQGRAEQQQPGDASFPGRGGASWIFRVVHQPDCRIRSNTLAVMRWTRGSGPRGVAYAEGRTYPGGSDMPSAHQHVAALKTKFPFGPG